MADKDFTVLDLLDLNLKGHNSLNLRCINGRRGLDRKITIPDLNRPGLVLSGFFESFAYQRVQVFGRGEVAYLHKLISENNTTTIKQLFTYTIPCCVFTHGLEIPEQFSAIAEEAGCPVCPRIWSLRSFLRGFCAFSPAFLRPKRQCTAFL